MTITENLADDIFTLSVEGNVDTITAPELQDKILAGFGQAKDVVVDMTDCPYVSSAGLRVFLMGQKEAKKKGGSMTITHVPETVMAVFKVSNFDRVLTIK